MGEWVCEKYAAVRTCRFRIVFIKQWLRVEAASAPLEVDICLPMMVYSQSWSLSPICIELRPSSATSQSLQPSWVGVTVHTKAESGI